MSNQPTYLGDGLYVQDTGFDVQLFCDRENGRNWVALEGNVLSEFFSFLERSRGVKITVEKLEEKQ